MTGATGEGRIITFYSFKGGTGRSMTLANVAWILASNGHRVLVVDWDLEAPGVHRYFHPFLLDKELVGTPGLLDMIWDFALAAMNPAPEDDQWFIPYADVVKFAVSLRHSFEGGALDLLPAGRQDPTYGRKVGSFNWANFYNRLGGGHFIEALKRSMREEYDYILIDSRTGLSDTSGICTVQLPDTLVACFTLNTQSIAGASEVAAEVNRQRQENPPITFPVLMRVDDSGSTERLNLGRDYARSRFDHLLTRMDPAELQRYWGAVEIPYRSAYSYEEILATVGDRPGQRNSILAACEWLTGYLTDGAVTRLVPTDETQRRAMLAQFQQARLPMNDSSFFISSHHADHRWAEWIADVMQAAGGTVFRPWTIAAGSNLQHETDRALSRASHVLAIVSDGYLASQSTQREWRGAIETDPSGTLRRLLPVRVVPCEMPAELRNVQIIDLVGADETEATRLLLDSAIPGKPYSTASIPPKPRTARFPGGTGALRGVPDVPHEFADRLDTLAWLSDHLGRRGDPATVALTGMAGVGKSVTAAAFCRRSVGRYDQILWLDARDKTAVHQRFVEANSELDDRSAVLIVADGVGLPDELMSAFGEARFDILVTSQYRQWAAYAPTHHLDSLPALSAIKMLQRQVPGLGELEAGEIAGLVGGLPLALAQAVTYLQTTDIPPQRYVELLRRRPEAALTLVAPGAHPPAAWLALYAAVAEVGKRSQPVGQLLDLLAMFAATPLPLSALLEGRDRLNEPLRGAMRDDLDVEKLIDDLTGLYLAQRDRGDRPTVRLHPAVRALGRALVAERRPALQATAMGLLQDGRDDSDPRSPQSWPTWELLAPHVMQADTAASGQFPLLRNDVCRYLFTSGDWRRCAALVEDCPDEEGQALAGTVWYGLGAYRRSAEIFRKLFPVLLDEYGAGDTRTLYARHGMALSLHAVGNYEEATLLNEELLELHGRARDADPAQALAILGSLVNSLQGVGRSGRALHLATELHERALNLTDADAALSLNAENSLAVALYFEDRLDDARRQADAALQRCSQILGDRHPSTLSILHDLAVIVAALDGPRAARILAEEALKSRQEILGDKHPDALWSRFNVLVLDSRMDDSRPVDVTAVLAGQIAHLGVDHPELRRIRSLMKGESVALWAGHHPYLYLRRSTV
jgi:cellulose biosynthesis protein BcsQ/tetratricopeptide (TPR) repeat protein